MLPAPAVMVVFPVVIAIDSAMIVSVEGPATMVAIESAVVISIVVTIRPAIVVAVANAANIVPITRHPVAAVIVSIHPRVSRTGARRNVGLISDTHCHSQLGCVGRVGSKH
jgi:hypothetical protein